MCNVCNVCVTCVWTTHIPYFLSSFLASSRSFSMPSPSACPIFLMAAWTRCSARAPATQNTPCTRCVCVRAASCTCPPLTAPPPARPPTACVYGAESGVGASPDTRKAFPFFLLPSFLSHSVHLSPPSRQQQLHWILFTDLTPKGWIRCHLDGVCVFFLLIIHTSFFLFQFFYPFLFFLFIIYILFHSLLIVLQSSSPPSLIASFPLSFLQEFRNRYKLGSIVASSSRSVNGAETGFGAYFSLSCFLVLLFLYAPLPQWRLMGKLDTRPDQANENEHPHTHTACARSSGCVCVFF